MDFLLLIDYRFILEKVLEMWSLSGERSEQETFGAFCLEKQKDCLTKTRSSPHICGVQKLFYFLCQLEATTLCRKVLETEKNDFWGGGF